MNETNSAKKVGKIGVIANIFLLTIKFVVGFLFKSQALIADAINSLGDVFSSLLTYVGGKISAIPEDDEHEFGHGKAEFVASLLIGIFMVIVSIDMIYDSVASIIYERHFIFSWLLILTPIITMVVKTTLYFYVNNVGKNTKSLLITANAKDHRNDVIISLGVIIGIILGYFGFYAADGIIGGVISIIIAITGIKIVYEAYQVLIDKCIDVEIVKEIREEIESYDNVKHVDSIKSKPTGNLHMLIVKISVEPDMTVRESHKIAGKIRGELLKRDNIYDVLVHINPDE